MFVRGEKMNETNKEVSKRRCDSCGNPQSYRYYNKSFLCKACFLMDNRGTPREKTGKVYRGKKDENTKT